MHLVRQGIYRNYLCNKPRDWRYPVLEVVISRLRKNEGRGRVWRESRNHVLRGRVTS